MDKKYPKGLLDAIKKYSDLVNDKLGTRNPMHKVCSNGSDLFYGSTPKAIQVKNCWYISAIELLDNGEGSWRWFDKDDHGAAHEKEIRQFSHGIKWDLEQDLPMPRWNILIDVMLRYFKLDYVFNIVVNGNTIVYIAFQEYEVIPFKLAKS